MNVTSSFESAARSQLRQIVSRITPIAKNITKVVHVPLFCLMLALPVSGQPLGLYAPDARAIGLGGSLAALSRDQAAIFWNPALLIGLKSTGLLVSMNDPLEIGLLSASHFVPRIGTFGLALSRAANGTADLDIGSVAWARSLTRSFSAGGALNIENLGSRWTAALDWGVFVGNPNIGASVAAWRDLETRNLLDRVSFGATVKSIPLGSKFFDTSVLLGFGYAVPVSGLIFNAGYHFNKGDNTGHLGLGYAVTRHFAIFGGLDDLSFRNVGLGSSYSLRNLSFNLSYSARRERVLLTLSSRIGPAPVDLAKPHYNRGMRFVKGRQYTQASAELQKFLAYETGMAAEDTARQMVFFLSKRELRVSVLVDSLFREADKLLDPAEPHFLRAALLYTRILQLAPQNQQAMARLASLQPAVDKFLQDTVEEGIYKFESGDHFSARKLFQRVIMFEQEDATALYYLSNIEKILSERAEDYFYQGIGYFKQGDYASAQEALQLALQYDPKLKEAEDYLVRTDNKVREKQYRIGSLLTRASDLERASKFVEATNTYLEVLRLEQDNAVAQLAVKRIRPKVTKFIQSRYQEAVTAFEQGDLLRAQQRLQAVLSLDPEHNDARTMLGKVRAEVSARATFYLNQADGAFNDGDLARASQIYADVLAISPGNDLAIQGEAKVRKREEVGRLIVKAYQQAAAHQYQEALATLEQARMLAPDNREVLDQIREVDAKFAQLIDKVFNDGINLYTRDRYEDAARFFKRVLALNPSHEGAKGYLEKTEQRILALKRLN